MKEYWKNQDTSLSRSACRKSFSVSAPKIWNALPKFIRDSDSLQIFIRKFFVQKVLVMTETATV